MIITFHKMHGCGNDYVYVDLKESPLESSGIDLPRLAQLVSHRNYAIGGDGLILIADSKVADARMRIFNADGSEAEMCGNGIRCVAKYLHDRRRIEDKAVIETKGGPIGVEIIDEAGGTRVRVDMGKARLTPAEIPTTLPGGTTELPDGSSGQAVVRGNLKAGGRDFEVTCVSMGNPHCVIFTENIDEIDLPLVGASIENHPAFPSRTNVEFVEVVGEGVLKQRTWERGSGETLACGTGASASLVAASLCGLADQQALIHLRGGDLDIAWEADGTVYMTGPATYVFSGATNSAKLERDRIDLTSSEDHPA